MRKFIPVLVLSLMSLSVVGSHADDTQTGPAAQKDWTLLVYMNGNNSLDDFGKVNLKQMEKVGSTAQVNVVVQWASMAASTTKRLLVKKDSSNSADVTSPILADIGNVDMGDYNTLIDFVKWGVAQYPAKHYFIDVWDHGSGWHSYHTMGASKAAGKLHINDISLDENTGHWITTQQLGQAIAASAQIIGHKVDIYGSDACLMAMAEVAGEMADSVNYFVGSQQTEPGAGWPYTELLIDWNAQANTSAAQVSKYLVKEYVGSYNGGSNGSEDATFSAFDMSKLAAFETSVSNLGVKFRTLSQNSRQAIVNAAKASLSFTNQDYDDVLDFLNQIEKSDVRDLTAADFTEVRSAAGSFIIANADTSSFATAAGLSIWLPSDKGTYSTYSDLYKQLKFDTASGWASTLEYLLQDDSSHL